MIFPLSISKEEVMQRPLGRYEGKIIVLDSSDRIDQALDQISNSKVVGFDTEAKPTFKGSKKENISYSGSH